MPLTLTALVRGGKLCHGSRRVTPDEDDLVRKLIRPPFARSCQVAAILAYIDKKAPAPRAGAAESASASRLSAPFLFVCGEKAC